MIGTNLHYFDKLLSPQSAARVKVFDTSSDVGCQQTPAVRRSAAMIGTTF